METPADSPAPAETSAPTPESETPPVVSTAETTATPPAPAPAEPSEDQELEQLRAEMRKPENNGVLLKPRDAWTDLEAPTGDEPPAAEEPAPPTGEQPTGEAEPPTPPTPNPPESEKEPKRVRLTRYSQRDRLILARANAMESPDYIEAEKALISEGKIAARAASTPESTTAPTEAAPATDTLSAKEQEIADLEKQMEEAGNAFDTPKIAKLTTAHNRALVELAELKRAATTNQAEVQTQLQSDIAESETAAVQLFPDAGVEGSELHEEIAAMIADAEANNPALLQDPNYPLNFAAQAARNIGYVPKPKAAAPTPPPVVPAKPSRPVPVSPASGSSAPASTPRQLTPQQEAEKALADDDPEAMRAALRKLGTRTLDGEE